MQQALGPTRQHWVLSSLEIYHFQEHTEFSHIPLHSNSSFQTLQRIVGTMWNSQVDRWTGMRENKQTCSFGNNSFHPPSLQSLMTCMVISPLMSHDPQNDFSRERKKLQEQKIMQNAEKFFGLCTVFFPCNCMNSKGGGGGTNKPETHSGFVVDLDSLYTERNMHS
ncbi:UNVERIFIED_CONTAM: hypothetical protein K2H54_044992 [Gekko kuhli]